MKPFDTSVMNAKFLFPLSCLILMAGCIKEDRSDCPCRLVLDFSDVDTTVVTSADLSVTSDDGFGYAETVDRTLFDNYMLTVPRTFLDVCVWAGAGYFLNDDMSVSIPYGEDCPKVFLHASTADTDCELLEQKVEFKKNHCVLTIEVDEGKDYPFELTVKGHIDGYGRDLRPSVGDFSCKAVPDSAGRCVVVLPRQLDSSLMLEINDGTESVKIFTLGESIVAGGYDWDAPELDDVEVRLDYSLTEVALEIVEWDDEHVYDIII